MNRYIVYDISNRQNYQYRGYWYDNGKLYKDYIQPIKINGYNKAVKKAKDICINKNQLCVFIEGKNKCFIVNSLGCVINILKAKKVYTYRGISQLKALLKKYNGLTIKKTRQGYKILISV